MEPDRVSYSFGLKVNLGNFESASIHASFSTDVKEGEDFDTAVRRAAEEVETFVDSKREELK